MSRAFIKPSNDVDHKLPGDRVYLITEAIGFSNPAWDNKWPWVWWILTGLLSQLPLHAAGIINGIHSNSLK
jgi:hypothetical protein